VTWTAQEWGRGSPFFISHQLLEYEQHTFPVTVERTARVVPALVSHSMVAPGLRNNRAKFRRMPPGSSGPVGVVATGAWWALLGLGAVALAREARRRGLVPLAVTTAGGLAFAVAMHLTLGREMFLYAMDVLPLLLVVAAAAAWPERGRGAVRVVACVLVLAGAVNNAQQLVKSAEAANKLASQRVGR
jgi:MYXO-CTERM domain-containing protein